VTARLRGAASECDLQLRAFQGNAASGRRGAVRLGAARHGPAGCRAPRLAAVRLGVAGEALPARGSRVSRLCCASFHLIA